MIRISVTTARTVDSSISFFSKGVLWRQKLDLKPKAQLGSLYLTTVARTKACRHADHCCALHFKWSVSNLLTIHTCVYLLCKLRTGYYFLHLNKSMQSGEFIFVVAPCIDDIKFFICRTNAHKLY
jgi:hypothetical protein